MEPCVSFYLVEVPAFLQQSDLFKTLNTDDDGEEITLPAAHCKFNLEITCGDDLYNILLTLQFWGSNEIPIEALDFFISNNRDENKVILNSLESSFETVRLFRTLNCNKDSSQYLQTSLVMGSLAAVQYMFLRGYTTVDTVDKGCFQAAVANSIDCLKYMHENGGSLNHLVVYASIKRGSTPCVLYCITNGIEPISEFQELAAKLGFMGIMNCLHKNNCPWSVKTCHVAAQYNQLACLKYAREEGCPWDVHTYHIAAKLGHIDILRYLHDQQCQWDESVCSTAAANGQLECLVYLHEQGCPWSAEACNGAAVYGHLDCLIYLHERNCPWESSMLSKVAANGHLHIMVYAHEEGLSLTAAVDICWQAARNDHYEILVFAHQCGCEMNESTILPAIAARSVGCLQYILDAGVRADVTATRYAAATNQLAILQCLHESKCPWDETVTRRAAYSGSLACLEYAHKHHCAWDKTVSEVAMIQNHADCFEYAVRHGCPVDSKIVELAEGSGNPIYKEILRNYRTKSKCVVC